MNFYSNRAFKHSSPGHRTRQTEHPLFPPRPGPALFLPGFTGTLGWVGSGGSQAPAPHRGLLRPSPAASGYFGPSFLGVCHRHPLTSPGGLTRRATLSEGVTLRHREVRGVVLMEVTDTDHAAWPPQKKHRAGTQAPASPLRGAASPDLPRPPPPSVPPQPPRALSARIPRLFPQPGRAAAGGVSGRGLPLTAPPWRGGHPAPPTPRELPEARSRTPGPALPYLLLALAG